MITIWKSIGVFLIGTTILQGHFINVERDKLNYEVLNVQIQDQNLIIDGWATMPDTQHFKDASTHAFELEVTSSNETINIPGTLTNHDLTAQMAYMGNKRCNETVMNTIACNFDNKKVGFRFKIPLNTLKEDQNYKLFLKMHAKQSNHRYRIPLFYASEKDIYLLNGRTEYLIQSDYKHVKFSIYEPTLKAKVKPDPDSDMPSGGTVCSTAYKNLWYLKQNAVFEDIYDIQIYNNQITYFKVRVVPYGCVNERLRLIESKTSNDYVYVPSTQVNYIGNPMIIYVRRLTSIPNIIVEDVTINQYETYEPLKYASASDRFLGNITDKIKVKSTNVNTRIPGIYQTCYEVYNDSNHKAEGCSTITVVKIPSKKRFVSKYTIHDTLLKRWDRQELTNLIKNERTQRTETFNP